MSHYHPKPRYRSNDASTHAHSLYDAVRPWVEQAITGQKRHRLESEAARGISRPVDSIVADCAQVLAACPDWDGALLAHHFALRGWPVDVDLVRLCHQWSCSLMDKIMTAYRHREANLRGVA